MALLSPSTTDGVAFGFVQLVGQLMDLYPFREMFASSKIKTLVCCLNPLGLILPSKLLCKRADHSLHAVMTGKRELMASTSLKMVQVQLCCRLDALNATT